MPCKQVILVRQDLKLTKGKMAAQVAHAAVECVLKTARTKVDAWRDEGMKKIVLKVNDLAELEKYLQSAQKNGLTTALITDAGMTHLEPGTTTCMGIGPDEEKKIDAITGKLKLVN